MDYSVVMAYGVHNDYGVLQRVWGPPWALSSVFCRDMFSMDPKASKGDEEKSSLIDRCLQRGQQDC